MADQGNTGCSNVHYAHTLPAPSRPGQWELLIDHLRRVAEGDGAALAGAASYAQAFGAQEWGRTLGWWHDLGKYSDAFQEYLSASAAAADLDGHQMELMGRVDHSTAGAQHAARSGALGQILAYCIAGHHTGLPDDDGGEAALSQRLKKAIEPYGAAPLHVLKMPLPPPPRLCPSADPRRAAFSIAFFTRMLFSCLVDADFLASEWFMRPDRTAKRPKASAMPDELLARLNAHLEDKQHHAPDTPVNRCRQQVLTACRQKAELPPGLFSLNVPTGGGKTLSSLAFALTHAAKNGLRRVIYAIPFTSIIEQTAEVFRAAMGDLASEVLEHHSNLDPDDPRTQSERSRLAAENFDAPLIVTTNVQLLESLFASRSSRCRKLHRLAKSVIVLDEAQTLTPHLLAPTLATLDELARNYGTTIVLCTATQPAIERREDFPIGLENVTRIIDDPDLLHQALHRTSVERAGELTDDELVERLAREPQVLCIVNSRRHAADLFKLLDDPGALHLSASMSAQHRAAVLRLVKWKLRRGQPCRVISTQVVEAGVDVDFPAVYRAAAGLDSVAQAAGRCNREGQLTDAEGRSRAGRVIVFDYDEQAHRPPPFVRCAAGHFREVIPEHNDDLLAPAAIERYFRLHYWQQGSEDGRGWDRGRGQASVMRCLGGDDGSPLHHQFRTAAERYQLIDDAQTPVLVPYGRRGRALIEELNGMRHPPGREFDRAAQRYVVGIRDHALRQLLDRGVLLERHGRYYLGNGSAYDRKLGLTLDAFGLDPEGLMA